MAAGGVGEAMLIGAAVGATAGGAGAAIQGGDPLKGALTGGAMGAVGGGLGAATGAGGAAAGGIDSAAAAAGGGGGGGAFVPAAGSGASFVAPTTGATIGTASNVGAGIGGVQAGSGTLGSAGFTPPPSGAIPSQATVLPAGYTPSTAGLTPAQMTAGSGIPELSGSVNMTGYNPYATAPTQNAGIAGANTTTPPTTNIFGQTAGTPGYLSNTQLGMTGATAGLAGAMGAERDMYGTPPTEEYDGPLNKLKYDPDKFTASNPQYAPTSVYRPTYAAQGGIMDSFRSGSYNNNADFDDEPGTDNLNNGGIARFDMGGMAFTGMPGGRDQTSQPSTGSQGIDALMGNKKRMMTKEQMDAIKMQGMSKGALNDVYGQMASQGLAAGGHLGSYSDGGRMLKGPGDGMSDNIPASIAGKQPARLADGEFVVPADVVSHLGNGSTDAGAKQLYAMMNRVRKARTGNPKQGKQIKPAKYMAA
jgi:hypothetical protein